MGATERDQGHAPYPDQVAIVGGGRWARVLVDVVSSLVPPSIGISVHSRSNASAMSAWADARGLGKRIQLSRDWPRPSGSGSCAVLIANAARDHEAAVEWALSFGFAVLVEKPLALTAAAAQRLADLAHERKARFAAAHVFLFARYIENYSSILAETGPIESLRIEWTDPSSEERYGESKRYDASLPVFADWLPHVLSIVGALLPRAVESCRTVEVRKGGAEVKLELIAGDVPCVVRMERNAAQRRRIINAFCGKELIQLDFSTEPGTITHGSSAITGDPHWGSSMHPAPCMAAAFLRWAAGAESDARLDIASGVRACKIIDQVQTPYRSAVIPWLVSRLSGSLTLDDDLRYTLAEVLQTEAPLTQGQVEQQILALMTALSGSNGSHWTTALTQAEDVVQLLRTLAASRSTD